MRRIVLLLALVAASVVAGGAAGATATPRLRIVEEQPLVVAGRAFEPRELVTVRAVGTFGTRSLHVRATGSGTFRLRFRTLSGDPCSLRRLTAAGTHGSRAVLRLPPAACQPPGNPPG